MALMIQSEFRFEQDFQNSLLYLLCTDVKFFLRFSSYIQPTYFTNLYNQQIFRNAEEFFKSHKKLPNKEELNNSTSMYKENLELEEYRSQVEIVLDSIPETPEFIEQQISTFCKHNEVVLAILNSADIVETKKYEKIKEHIDRALSIGVEELIAYDFFEEGNVKERRTGDYRETVPTLIPELDRMLNGGLAKGELGVIVAPPKRGKTTTMINFATTALYQGKFAVYVTLEMPARQIAHKMESRISGVSNVYASETQEHVLGKISKLKKNGCEFRILSYPMYFLTVEQLKKDLKYVEMSLERKIDVVFVDYLTILRTRSGEGSVDGWTDIAANLRGLATEMDFPMWTAIQSNKEGVRSETLDLAHTSRSYEIGGVADVMLGLNQTLAESNVGTARIGITASRVGPSPVEISISLIKDKCTMLPQSKNVEKDQTLRDTLNTLKSVDE